MYLKHKASIAFVLLLAPWCLNGGSLIETKFPNRFEVDYVRVYQQ